MDWLVALTIGTAVFALTLAFLILSDLPVDPARSARFVFERILRPAILWLKHRVRRAFALAFAAGLALVMLQANEARASLHIATTLRDTWATSLRDSLDAGTACVIEIRTLANPGSGCAAGATGTLLGTLTCSATSGTIATGVFTYNAISDDASADADGTAAHFEILTQTAGTCVYTGSITATGGGGDLTLNTVTIVTAARIRMTGTSTITMPGA